MGTVMLWLGFVVAGVGVAIAIIAAFLFFKSLWRAVNDALSGID